MRVLLIDKTAVLAANHERFAALAEQPDVELHVLSPERWFEHGRSVTLERRVAEGYRIHTGHTLRQGHYGSSFFYTGLARAILRARPAIIQLLEEPWSFFAGQTMRWASILAPRAAIVFYTWENVYRDFDYVSRLRRIYRRIDHRMHRRAKGAICASPQAEEVLRLKGFQGPTRIIPYGVSQVFFTAGERRARNHASRQGGGFTIGYIGRFLEMKGVQHLIQALSVVEGAQLVLVGSGEYEPVLRRQAERLGIDGRVRWVPPQPPERIPDYLWEMDVLVLPSQAAPHWTEQMGRVVVEAMAAGVPVIASDSGALPDVVGDAGLLFREGKWRELAERLIYLRNNDGVRQALMLRGLEHARRRYTWQRFAHELADFWRRDILG